MHGRQTAERALLESDERYRAIIGALEEGIVIHEADGTISSCNASACRILGLSERELLGRSVRHPAWRALREDGSPFEPESDPAAITLLTGRPCSHVVMGIEKPGRPRVWISINSRPLRRSAGSDLYAVAVSFTDITRHKATEEELRRRAFQQAAIAELGRHALEGTGIDLLLDEAVRRTAAILQVEHCKIVDAPDGGAPRLRASTGWMDLDGQMELAAQRPGRDGSALVRTARLAGISVPIPGRQRPWGMLSAHTRADRSFSPEDTDFLQAVANVLAVAIERQQGQEAVRTSQEAIRKAATEWRLTFDTIDDPVLLLEMDGRIVRLNEAARQLADLSFDEVLHRPLAGLGGGEPWQALCELLPQVGVTGEAAFTQVRDALGRTWDVSLQPVTSPDTQPGVVAVARDVTEQARLQESLRRSETMSAMGALVAGVAHEVRNPLFGISATLDAFASRFKRRTEYRRYLDVLQGEVNRLNELMKDLLDYGKPFRLVLAPERPEEVMRLAIADCAPLAAQAGVEIVADAPDLPCLLLDRNRAVQLFRNLLENAIQHSPHGSRIAFRAERCEDDAGGAGVRFHVEDAGPGFQPQDLPRLFEPFFTRRRGGTGMGLSIVQRIVEQHGGEIVPANRPAGGAVVSVTLPLGPDPGKEPA